MGSNAENVYAASRNGSISQSDGRQLQDRINGISEDERIPQVFRGNLIEAELEDSSDDDDGESGPEYDGGWWRLDKVVKILTGLDSIELDVLYNAHVIAQGVRILRLDPVSLKPRMVPIFYSLFIFQYYPELLTISDLNTIIETCSHIMHQVQSHVREYMETGRVNRPPNSDILLHLRRMAPKYSENCKIKIWGHLNNPAVFNALDSVLPNHAIIKACLSQLLLFAVEDAIQYHLIISKINTDDRDYRILYIRNTLYQFCYIVSAGSSECGCLNALIDALVALRKAEGKSYEFDPDDDSPQVKALQEDSMYAGIMTVTAESLTHTYAEKVLPSKIQLVHADKYNPLQEYIYSDNVLLLQPFVNTMAMNAKYMSEFMQYCDANYGTMISTIYRASNTEGRLAIIKNLDNGWIDQQFINLVIQEGDAKLLETVAKNPPEASNNWRIECSTLRILISLDQHNPEIYGDGAIAPFIISDKAKLLLAEDVVTQGLLHNRNLQSDLYQEETWLCELINRPGWQISKSRKVALLQQFQDFPRLVKLWAQEATTLCTFGDGSAGGSSGSNSDNALLYKECSIFQLHMYSLHVDKLTYKGSIPELYKIELLIKLCNTVDHTTKYSAAGMYMALGKINEYCNVSLLNLCGQLTTGAFTLPTKIGVLWPLLLFNGDERELLMNSLVEIKKDSEFLHSAFNNLVYAFKIGDHHNYLFINDRCIEAINWIFEYSGRNNKTPNKKYSYSSLGDDDSNLCITKGLGIAKYLMRYAAPHKYSDLHLAYKHLHHESHTAVLAVWNHLGYCEHLDFLKRKQKKRIRIESQPGDLWDQYTKNVLSQSLYLRLETLSGNGVDQGGITANLYSQVTSEICKRFFQRDSDGYVIFRADLKPSDAYLIGQFFARSVYVDRCKLGVNLHPVIIYWLCMPTIDTLTAGVGKETREDIASIIKYLYDPEDYPEWLDSVLITKREHFPADIVPLLRNEMRARFAECVPVLDNLEQGFNYVMHSYRKHIACQLGNVNVSAYQRYRYCHTPLTLWREIYGEPVTPTELIANAKITLNVQGLDSKHSRDIISAYQLSITEALLSLGDGLFVEWCRYATGMNHPSDISLMIHIYNRDMKYFVARTCSNLIEVPFYYALGENSTVGDLTNKFETLFRETLDMHKHQESGGMGFSFA